MAAAMKSALVDSLCMLQVFWESWCGMVIEVLAGTLFSSVIAALFVEYTNNSFKYFDVVAGIIAIYWLCYVISKRGKTK